MTPQDVQEAVNVAWLKFKRETDYKAIDEQAEKDDLKAFKDGFLMGCQWSNENFKRVMKARGWKQ